MHPDSCTDGARTQLFRTVVLSQLHVVFFLWCDYHTMSSRSEPCTKGREDDRMDDLDHGTNNPEREANSIIESQIAIPRGVPEFLNQKDAPRNRLHAKIYGLNGTYVKICRLHKTGKIGLAYFVLMVKQRLHISLPIRKNLEPSFWSLFLFVLPSSFLGVILMFSKVLQSKHFECGSDSWRIWHLELHSSGLIWAAA